MIYLKKSIISIFFFNLKSFNYYFRFLFLFLFYYYKLLILPKHSYIINHLSVQNIINYNKLKVRT